jgi:MFS transporter, DHA2 family, methylenomycin A resistance protein
LETTACRSDAFLLGPQWRGLRHSKKWDEAYAEQAYDQRKFKTFWSAAVTLAGGMATATQVGSDGNVSPRLYGRVIVLSGLGLLITSSDLSIANVALKSIGEGLKVPPGMLSWVVSSNALTLAGFLILGGRASDIYGPRNCLLFGTSLFSVGCFLSAFALNIDMLIVTRALQGIGAAVLSPSSFSLINTVLPEGPVRHRAFGILGVSQGLSVAIGLVLGGIVASSIGWRACFLINLPLAAGALVLAWQVVPRMLPPPVRPSLDYMGAVMACGAIALVILALSAIGAHGLASFQGLGLLAGGLAAFILFFVHERRAEDPMMPLSIFRYRNVIGANLVMICALGGNVGVFIIISSFMQTMLGFSAMTTGVAMIPFALTVMLGGPVAHFAMARWSLRAIIIASSLTGVAGSLLLAWVAAVAPGYWTGILPAMCVVASGSVVVFVALMAAGTAAAPARQQGVASALVMTSHQIGVAVGASIALMVLGAAVAAHDPISRAFCLAFVASGVLFVLGLALVFALIRGDGRV